MSPPDKEEGQPKGRPSTNRSSSHPTASRIPNHTANGIPLQLRRRRGASWRLAPLDCGCVDPWPCRCTEPPLSEWAIDGWRDAAQHILANGAMPIVPIEVRRALWHRPADRALAELLHTGCAERIA
jgi:hypothetical protein